MTLGVSVLLFGPDRPGRADGMVGVDKIGEIRRAYFEQERPIKEIVRTLSVSRATVRKITVMGSPTGNGLPICDSTDWEAGPIVIPRSFTICAARSMNTLCETAWVSR